MCVCVCVYERKGGQAIDSTQNISPQTQGHTTIPTKHTHTLLPCRHPPTIHTHTPSHHTHLSLMIPSVPPVVQHTVTLTTQVPTLVTQDQRLRLSVVMVITERLVEGTNDSVTSESLLTTSFPGHMNRVSFPGVAWESCKWASTYLGLWFSILTQPLSRGESFSVLLINYTQGSKTQP